MNQMIIKGINQSVKIFVILTVSIILTTISISYSSYVASDYQHKLQFFQPVLKKLLKKGVDSAFIYSLIKSNKTHFNERFVKINVTGYLKKPDYSSNYNYYSVHKCKEFLKENRETLDSCSKHFDVPKEIIIAILWIETKFGNVLGENHIPSVFLSTAMANQAQFINMNEKILRNEFKGDDKELAGLIPKIKTRASKKSEWAMNELASLSKMVNQKNINVHDLYGSWAGAFGLSQFLPSSYIDFAIDGNADGRIDLFDVDDAIFSIANYLKKNGWAADDSSHRKAVYHYNNSNDYVDAVIKLASKISYNSNFQKPVAEQLNGFGIMK